MPQARDWPDAPDDKRILSVSLNDIEELARRKDGHSTVGWGERWRTPKNPSAGKEPSMRYRRAQVGRGAYFFTINFAERNRIPLVNYVDVLQSVMC
jgi:hypothetical protein